MSEIGISIIIPAYNEENFLPATVNSIKKAQNYFKSTNPKVPSEIVIVNNASTDNTKQISLDLGARVVDFDIRNISAVRNAGIQAGKYQHVIMIDADSFLSENALTEVFSELELGETIGGNFHVKVITDKFFYRHLAAFCLLLAKSFLSVTGGMFYFNRNVALSFGGFREDRLVAEDSMFTFDLKTYATKYNKRFKYLKQVTIGTLDRKETNLQTLLSWTIQALAGLLGKKQKIEDLDYWYKPNR